MEFDRSSAVQFGSVAILAQAIVSSHLGSVHLAPSIVSSQRNSIPCRTGLHARSQEENLDKGVVQGSTYNHKSRWRLGLECRLCAVLGHVSSTWPLWQFFCTLTHAVIVDNLCALLFFVWGCFRAVEFDSLLFCGWSQNLGFHNSPTVPLAGGTFILLQLHGSQ